MKVGENVLTRHGECGTISKRWEHEDDSYDWWVSIDFMFQGKEFNTLEPHKEETLTLVEEINGKKDLGTNDC